MIKIDFAKYIDVPFKDKGRDLSGLDCWGVPYVVFLSELGIEIPDFLYLNYCANTWSKDGNNIKKHFLENINEKWDIVHEPFKRFDIHFFYDKCNIVAHVGLCIGNGCFIHAISDDKVVKSKISVWRKKLYGTIRWRELHSEKL